MISLVKRIISIPLTLLLTISLFVFGYTYSYQQKFSAIEDAEAKSISESIDEFVENIDFSKVTELWKNVFPDHSKTKELIKYFVKSAEFEEIMIDYRKNYMQYLDKDAQKPVIDAQRVETALQNSITKYNEEHEESLSLDTSKETREVIASALAIITNNKKINKYLGFVYNPKYQTYAFYISVILIVLLAIVSHKRLKKYLGKPFVVNAILFGIIYFLINKEKLPYFKYIFPDSDLYFKNLALIYLSIAIIFYVVVGIIKARKDK